MPWVIDYQDKIYTGNTPEGKQVAVDIFVEATADIFDQESQWSDKTNATAESLVERLDLVVRWEEEA